MHQSVFLVLFNLHLFYEYFRSLGSSFVSSMPVL